MVLQKWWTENRGVACDAPVGAGPMDFGDSDADLGSNTCAGPLDLGDDDPQIFVSCRSAGSDKWVFTGPFEESLITLNTAGN